jgi:hypothetical protein
MYFSQTENAGTIETGRGPENDIKSKENVRIQ